MATQEAFQFCELVASSDFATKHSDLLEPMADAVAKEDPDAVARLAAAKLELHFTGDELKQAGKQVADGATQVVAAVDTVSFAQLGHPVGSRDVHGPFGPGGARLGVPGAGVPGADLGIKVGLQILARRLIAEGKSPEEVRQILMGVAGGGEGPAGQAIDDSHLTGNDVVDDVLKSVASVALGTAQSINDAMKKISDTIFSHW